VQNIFLFGIFMQLPLLACPHAFGDVAAVARRVAFCWWSWAAGSFGFCVSIPDALILKAFKFSYVSSPLFRALVDAPKNETEKKEKIAPSLRYPQSLCQGRRIKRGATVAPLWGSNTNKLCYVSPSPSQLRLSLSLRLSLLNVLPTVRESRPQRRKRKRKCCHCHFAGMAIAFWVRSARFRCLCWYGDIVIVFVCVSALR